MKRIIIGITILVAIIVPGFFVSFDGDNRTFVSEVTGETSPFSPDTDGDGLEDGQEVNNYGTNPTKTDTDGDGIEDRKEIHKYETNPSKIDSDGDGMDDLSEVNRGTNPTSEPECNIEDKNTDSDSDGLSNYEECRLGTNPDKADTDGDGLTDYEEFEGVTDSGIELPDSNPTHMDLYVTIVETNNTDFDSYNSPYSGAYRTDTEKNKTKQFFSNTRVENPNGQNGIDIHFRTVEASDEEIDLSNLSDEEREDIRKKYHNKYDDSYVHTIYVLTELGDNATISGEARSNAQRALGIAWWPTLSHEVLHTVIYKIDGSDCPYGDNTHVCPEDDKSKVLMDKNSEAYLPDRLSHKTINEIEEDGFSTND